MNISQRSGSWGWLGVVLVLLAGGWLSLAYGQYGGSRAGVEGSSGAAVNAPRFYDPNVAEAFIAIDGRAEMRVAPTEIRIVLALTSEGLTADACQQQIAAQLQRLTDAWTANGIAAENIVEDFIAVLPRYRWEVEHRDDVDMAVEKRVGYRMQTNVHLAVDDEPQAKRALTNAFALGVTDIIAFDYWSRDLDEIKVQARAAAIEAAQSKADALLAMFDDRPPVINVQEETHVHYPESLYVSFTNVADDDLSVPSRRDIPRLHAYRPRNTYYRGLDPHADRQSPELPMKPEISVVSSVRVYYASPAAPHRVRPVGGR